MDRVLRSLFFYGKLHALAGHLSKAIYQLYRLRPIGAGSPGYGYGGFIGEDEGVNVGGASIICILEYVHAAS